MAQLNAFRAIKAVHGKLPVNLIVVAEGDEERMDIGLRKWVKDHPELLEGADAMYPLRQPVAERRRRLRRRLRRLRLRRADDERARRGAAGRRCRDIHGSNKRGVDSPAWRHIKMLASLVSDDGNTPLIDGFFDGIQPLSAEQEATLKRRRPRAWT